MTPRRSLALQALLGAMLGLALLLAPPAALQRGWLDTQLRHAAPAGLPSGVLVIDIDDASLRQMQADFGGWPLGRDVYALAIEALREAGARAIVIDLLLADARPGDAALVRSLQREGPPVLLAAAGLKGTTLLSHARPGEAFEPVPPDHQRWDQMVLPSESLLATASPKLGVVSMPLDADGQLRHWVLLHATQQGRWPSMPLAVLQALGEPQRLAADAQGRVTPLLHGQVNTLPFAKLVQEAREGRTSDGLRRAVRDQVVFIGASNLLADRVMTAHGQQSGTALLADAYAALRDGRGLSPLPSGAQLGLLGLALLPALLAILRGQGAPRRFAIEALAVLSALALLLVLLAPFAQHWLDATAALAVLLATGAMHVLWHARQAQRAAERMARERELTETASRAKSAFLANISHELRTPLASMLGLAELLDQGPLDDTQRRQVHLLGSAGRNLLNLIDELLDLSRIDLQRLQLRPQPTQLPQLLRDVVGLIQAQAQAQQQAQIREVRCESLLADDLPSWVAVDAQRLSQVLLNLLGNALKFTPRGRVALHASRLPDGRVQFAVSDTGIGIADSQLQRIFEPFLQAQGTREGLVGGTGLGLAISRQLVRLMGGDIEVQSVPGSGSRFTFALALPPAEAAPPPQLADAAPLPHGLHVLLAEDDEVLAEVLQAQLAQWQLRVERAANGHLALALARRLDFDLILLDLNLPGLDGLRVARELRAFEAREGSPRTPVIALSAYAHGEDAALSRAAGCDEHLSKPFRQQQLLAALRRWAPAQARSSEGGAAAPAQAVPGSLRHAHAAVFLGRWGESWNAARQDTEGARRLLDDLLACAQGIDDAGLVAAAEALQANRALPVPRARHQHELEQALQQAVEAALLKLR